MKRHIIRVFPLLLMILLVACQGTNDKSPGNLIKNPKTAGGKKGNTIAEISFTNEEHDFGRLIQGEVVSHIFRYTNTGNADLIISKISASCGCTASKYTQGVVKPGEEGTVEVSFDSNGQRGIQNKTISVLTNGNPSAVVLRVKAQVVTAANY